MEYQKTLNLIHGMHGILIFLKTFKKNKFKHHKVIALVSIYS